MKKAGWGCRKKKGVHVDEQEQVSLKRVRSVLDLSPSYVFGQHTAVAVVLSIRSHVYGLHLAREGRVSIWITHKGRARGEGKGMRV